jgi:membrane glycosyltransferase
MNEPSPARRRIWRAWGASIERFLGYHGLEDGLKAAREDRPPVDLAVGLRRQRMGAAVVVLSFLGCGVLFVVQARPTLIAIVGVALPIVGIVIGVATNRGRAEAAHEDRAPVDLAVGLRRQRMKETVGTIWRIGVGVLMFAKAGTTFFGIAGLVMVVFLVCDAGRVIVGTRRTKRGRRPSGPPRELSMADELLAKRRAEAAREGD